MEFGNKRALTKCVYRGIIPTRLDVEKLRGLSFLWLPFPPSSTEQKCRYSPRFIRSVKLVNLLALQQGCKPLLLSILLRHGKPVLELGNGS